MDRGEDVIVGVNRYRLQDEPAVEIREIDNSALRDAQIRRLDTLRKQRNQAACDAALAQLEAGARAEDNILELAITAARARASLGEISSALERAFDRHHASGELIQGVYGAAYENDEEYKQLRHKIATRERAPHILVAKLGQDGHDRGAKVIASAFGDLGYAVSLSDMFETPAEICAKAIDLGVDVIGVSSLAAGHKTLIPQVIDALRKAKADHILVVAGGVIPEQDYAFLRDAGVAEIFGPGTNVLDAANAVLARIEGVERNI